MIAQTSSPQKPTPSPGKSGIVEKVRSTIVSPKIVSNVMENSTHIFDGVVIQDILGTFFVSVFPESGKCYQINIKELEKHKIVDAKYKNNVLIVVAEQKGSYSKFIFRFDKSYQQYDMRLESNIQYSGINFIVLDNGICIHMNDNDDLEIFSNQKDLSHINVINDPIINGQITLFNRGTQVLCAKDNRLYKISMKSN